MTDPEKKVSWYFGEGVVTQLFRKGYYAHILENIFFRLDPASLLACSLVCKEWNRFLEQRVWNTLDGERRITHNWIKKEPIKKLIRIKSRADCVSSSLSLAQRPDIPRSIVATEDAIVVSILGWIELYDRQATKLKRRLHDTDITNIHWKLSISKKYLIARQLSVQGGPILVFDVQNDFKKVPMEEKYPKDMVLSPDIEMVTDNTFIIEGQSQFLGKRSFFSYFIDEESKLFQFLWQLEVPEYHTVTSLSSDFILLANSSTSGDSKHTLSVYSVITGCQSTSMTFESESRFEIKSVALTMPLAVALAIKLAPVEVNGYLTYRNSDYKFYICDLAYGFVIKILDLDCSSFFDFRRSPECSIKLQCDPPLGTLLMLGHGLSSTNTVIPIWHLPHLLQGDNDKANPHRIIKTGGLAVDQAVVASQHQLIYCTLKDNQPHLVDCEFWGNFGN